jgi:ABC-type polysaccharide/polyol phosphate export permease
MSWLDLKRYFLLSHLTYKSKYADSFIGILWIPLSSLFLIAVLTLVFRSNPNLDLLAYSSYITIGYLAWGFISESLNSHCDVFRVKRTELNSPGTQLFEVFLRALIDRIYVLFLNLFSLSFIFISGIIWEPFRVLVFFGALFSLMIASYLVTYLFSVICLFFPDFKRLISNFTRILFFSSPIFWGYGAELSGTREYFYLYNPITYFLETIRYGIGVDINMDVGHAFYVLFVIISCLAIASFFISKLTPPYLKNIQ